MKLYLKCAAKVNLFGKKRTAAKAISKKKLIEINLWYGVEFAGMVKQSLL